LVEKTLPSRSALANRISLHLARTLALAVLAASAYWSIRLGWADHLSYSVALAAREHAVQLVPLSAPFAERLARRREELGLESYADLERALLLDPENPDRLMQLGQRAEWTGNYAVAEQSLLAAAARSRLYRPRYLLAQYYFRRQSQARFWPWARAALEICPADCAPVFDLCWRNRPDGEWLSQNLIPPQPEIRREYLTYLTDSDRWEPSAAAARALAATATKDNVQVLVHYCEAALTHNQARTPAHIWTTLRSKGLLAGGVLDPERGTLFDNGGFEHAPTNQGFDWHLDSHSGISVASGPGQLRLTFSGREPEQCPLAWHFVSLEPGVRYRLSGEVGGSGDLDPRSIAMESIATESIAMEMDGAIARSATQRSGESQSTIFTASAEVGKVVLLYRRPPGSVRLEGDVSIAKVRLERVP
jgi:tetratricopeptide (TPR) repeat protein